jgi:hypothetical protein
MNSWRTFVLSIVALFAVVSLSAHGEQMAAAANNQGAEAVVNANGNLKVPRTTGRPTSSWVAGRSLATKARVASSPSRARNYISAI